MTTPVRSCDQAARPIIRFRARRAVSAQLVRSVRGGGGSRSRGEVPGLGLGRRGGGAGVPLGVILADVQVEERPGGVPEPAERAREAGHVILLG